MGISGPALTVTHAIDRKDLAAGDLLAYDPDVGAFKNGPLDPASIPALPYLADTSVLNSLSNVGGTPSGGQVLTFNGVSWDPQSPVTGGGATTLGGLSDVDTAGQALDDFLKFDGAMWKPAVVVAGDLPANTTFLGSAATGTGVVVLQDSPQLDGNVIVSGLLDINRIPSLALLYQTRPILEVDLPTNTTILGNDVLGTPLVDSVVLAGGETGTGFVVRQTSAALSLPTIDTFQNALHNHQDLAGGQTLDATAIQSGVFDTARIAIDLNDVQDVSVVSPGNNRLLKFVVGGAPLGGDAWIASLILESDLPPNATVLGNTTVGSGTSLVTTDSVLSAPQSPPAGTGNAMFGFGFTGTGDVVLKDLPGLDASAVVSGVFAPAQIPGGIGVVDIDDLGDVTIAVPVEGEALRYNATAGMWENSALPPGGSGATELDELSDVNLGVVAEGDFLRFTGGAWRDSPILDGDIVGFSGTWSDQQGGTGLAGWPLNHLLVGALTGPAIIIDPGLSQDFLRSNGPGSIPSFSPLAQGDLPSATTFLNNATVGSGSIVLATGVTGSGSVLTGPTVGTGDVVRQSLPLLDATAIASGLFGSDRIDLAFGELNDLDFVTSPPTNMQVVMYNQAMDKWEPSTIPAGGAGANELDELTDVSIPSSPGPQAAEYLRYSSGQWRNDPILAQDITGFLQVTQGGTSMSTWPAYNILVGNASGTATVALGTGVAGQSLVSRGPGNTPEWSGMELQDLSNVNSGAIAGDGIQYNGVSWVPGPLVGGSGATILDELLDVDVGVSPVDDQILLYSTATGTWINSTTFPALQMEEGAFIVYTKNGFPGLLQPANLTGFASWILPDVSGTLMSEGFSTGTGQAVRQFSPTLNAPAITSELNLQASTLKQDSSAVGIVISDDVLRGGDSLTIKTDYQVGSGAFDEDVDIFLPRNAFPNDGNDYVLVWNGTTRKASWQQFGA